MDANLQGMINLFIDIFGDDFIKNMGIIFTNWGQNKSDKTRRREMTKSK